MDVRSCTSNRAPVPGRRTPRAQLAKRLAAGAALCVSAMVPAHAEVQDRPAFRVDGLLIVWAADGVAGSTPVVSDFIIDTGNGTSAATSGDTDLIDGDVFTVVTGTLEAVDDGMGGENGTVLRMQNVPGGGFLTDTNGDRVMDRDDAFDAFRIRANTDLNTRRTEISSSFYVASNAPFAIDAQATAQGTTTPDMMNRIRLWLSVTVTDTDQNEAAGSPTFTFGTAAQFPNSGGRTAGSQANGRRLSTMTTARRVFLGNQRTARVRGTIMEQSVRFDLLYRYNDGPYDLSEGAYDAEAEVVYTLYIP